MVDEGILDPAKVTRSALQNATSVASLLTTESVVANIKEDTSGNASWRSGYGNDVISGSGKQNGKSMKGFLKV